MTTAYSPFRSARGAVRRVFGAAAATLAAMFFMTTGAAAQQAACFEHGKLVEVLDGRYSEEPIAAGLDSGGKLLEIFATVDRATWTMIMTTPEGTSCIVAAGEQWLSRHKPLYDPEV